MDSAGFKEYSGEKDKISALIEQWLENVSKIMLSIWKCLF